MALKRLNLSPSFRPPYPCDKIAVNLKTCKICFFLSSESQCFSARRRSSFSRPVLLCKGESACVSVESKTASGLPDKPDCFPLKSIQSEFPFPALKHADQLRPFPYDKTAGKTKHLLRILFSAAHPAFASPAAAFHLASSQKEEEVIRLFETKF